MAMTPSLSGFGQSLASAFRFDLEWAQPRGRKGGVSVNESVCDEAQCASTGWEREALITRTYDLHEASRAIERVYCPYTFKTSRERCGSSHTEMFSLEAGTVGLSRFAYGVPIEITPREFENFYLVLSTSRGSAEITDASAVFSGQNGMTVIASPERRWRFRYSHDNAQSVVRIPESRLNEVSIAFLGRPIRTAHPIAGCLEKAAQHRWLLLAENVRSLMGPDVTPKTRALLLPRAEELLLATLLVSQLPEVTSGRTTAQPATSAVLRRALRYIEQELDRPLTLEQIATSAKCSVRTLQRAFHDCHDKSVMQYVKEQRLIRVRDELKYSDNARSVTEVAVQWGFLQLGQFASDYRTLFGELPSQTFRAR
jgi:AraC-like DNA-binding protein